MQQMDWKRHTDLADVCRRASGRRHYNAVRQFQAKKRQRDVARLLNAGHSQSAIARALGVHRSTISRDIAALREQALAGKCPLCGRDHRTR